MLPATRDPVVSWDRIRALRSIPKEGCEFGGASLQPAASASATQCLATPRQSRASPAPDLWQTSHHLAPAALSRGCKSG